jgi:hypothetical protein
MNIVINSKNKMKIVVIFILIFIQTSTIIAQSTLVNYSDFTPERQLTVEKMGDFFDETVRANFPAKMDTSSYKAFFKCIMYNGGVSDIPYIMQVDRKKLAKINADLFQNEIYYFFYAQYLTIYVTNLLDDTLQYRDYNDTIPTVRSYSTPSPFRQITSWYPFLYNTDGYIQRTVTQNMENSLIRDMNVETKLTHSYDITLFIRHILNGNLREISNPVMKQMASVFFWRYICFCGGVDLVERKGFCDECCN